MICEYLVQYSEVHEFFIMNEMKEDEEEPDKDWQGKEAPLSLGHHLFIYSFIPLFMRLFHLLEKTPVNIVARET